MDVEYKPTTNVRNGKYVSSSCPKQTGGTQLHAVRVVKSEYTRTKHLLGKGNTQTHYKGSHIYTILGPIVNEYKRSEVSR